MKNNTIYRFLKRSLPIIMCTALWGSFALAEETICSSGETVVTQVSDEVLGEAKEAAVGCPRFEAYSIFGGKMVVFISDTRDAEIYYSYADDITTESMKVENGGYVEFTEGNHIIYAKAYYNGRWSVVARYKLELVKMPAPQVIVDGNNIKVNAERKDLVYFYTLDGSIPSPKNGRRMTSSGIRNPGGSEELKVIATKSGCESSEVVTVEITPNVNEEIPSPTFEVKPVYGGCAITLNAPAGGRIYLSFNTSKMTATDYYTVSGETIIAQKYDTLYARTYQNGQWSDVSKLIVRVPKVNRPTITKVDDNHVKVTTTTPGCSIVYINDLRRPIINTDGTPHLGRKINSSSCVIPLDKGRAINVICAREGFANSDQVGFIME